MLLCLLFNPIHVTLGNVIKLRRDIWQSHISNIEVFFAAEDPNKED
jgi:hypothetical protein